MPLPLPAAEVGRDPRHDLRLVDRARMVAMREQCGPLITQLIEIFAETTPEILAQMQDASDARAVRAAAHSLKGACQNVGAVMLADRCRTIEIDPSAADVDGLAALFAQTVSALRDASRA